MSCSGNVVLSKELLDQITPFIRNARFGESSCDSNIVPRRLVESERVFAKTARSFCIESERVFAETAISFYIVLVPGVLRHTPWVWMKANRLFVDVGVHNIGRVFQVVATMVGLSRWLRVKIRISDLRETRWFYFRVGWPDRLDFLCFLR